LGREFSRPIGVQDLSRRIFLLPYSLIRSPRHAA